MSGEVAVVEPTVTTPTPLSNQFDIVDVEAAKEFMDNYQELVEILLDESDYQQIGEKNAKKKSAWRKLATAFNISDSIVHEEETRDETGQIVSSKFYVQATLPNGRSATAVGVCSIYDKIRYHGDKRDKTQPSNFELRGRFSNAEHDVPSTAHTRAKSRAIADLIGAGEVSAEEMTSEKKSSKKTKKTKKTVKKTVTDRPSKPKTAPIETKAEVVKEEPAEVVEAELVTNEEPKKESKPKKKTINVLKEEYPQVGLAIANLQANKKKVTRENIVAELLRLYEENEVTLDEYRTAKKELVE